ncbi:DEAD/DEAH box helicase [Candidatus Poribacteria bacterium]|nr:DEAD/DEAH box helicase [Candidatus Poribacteria bacterium]
MDVYRFLAEIQKESNYSGQIVHLEEIPGKQAEYGQLNEPLNPQIMTLLSDQGIESLYTHQVDAVNAVRAGRNIVVVTGTASGKTLCYNIPVLEAALDDPEMTALYLFPTKALAHDQLRKLLDYREQCPQLPVISPYDGDLSRASRKKVQQQANIILTNPDMIHINLLPSHPRWHGFLQNLKFIVIDELHMYRGIFGSHCANLFRRLERICQHYECNPQFICCSATIGNPLEHAEKLTGKEMTLIDNDGSPRAPKKFIFWNPAVDDPLVLRRKSGNVEAVELMAKLILKGIRTITFTKNWSATELVLRYCREKLSKVSPELAEKVNSYRGGYLPEERREIEARLFSGELLGVVSTTALELGIDIGGLDACIIIGYPGTISATWQQAGRAGRGDEESLTVMVGYDTQINQYIMNHPDYFFGKPHEVALIVPNNQYILGGQLACACHELPLTNEEALEFGEDSLPILSIMKEEDMVHYSNGAWYYTGQHNPAYRVSLRNITSHNYTIIDTSDNDKVIGTIDQISAYPIAHPEAIYFHNGESYFVEDLDLEQHVVRVRKVDVDYYTSPLGGRGVTYVDTVEDEKDLPGLGRVYFGEVTAHFNTGAYNKIKLWTREVFAENPVNLPPQILETMSYWIVPSEETIRRMVAAGRIIDDGIYGLGQALMVITALFAHCYPLDVRYSSGDECATPWIPDYTIFIFDNYQGGLGFTERAYVTIVDLLQTTLSMIEECECEDGCPSCVGFYLRPHIRHDPENWEGRVPDKEGAIMLLHDFLGLEPYNPRPFSEKYRAWRDRMDSHKPEDVERRETARKQRNVELPDSLKTKLEKKLGKNKKL